MEKSVEERTNSRVTLAHSHHQPRPTKAELKLDTAKCKHSYDSNISAFSSFSILKTSPRNLLEMHIAGSHLESFDSKTLG